MKGFFLFLLLALALIPIPANADDADLSGMRTFYVIIENISSNECLLTKTDVDTSVRYVLSQSRMQLTTEGLEPAVYANVSMTHNCLAAMVDVQVRAPVTLIQTHRFAIGSIWEDGTILSGPDMRSRVLHAVEEVTKRLVIAWSQANP